MSILRADSIRDRAGTGAPDFPNGLTGTLTGNVTGNVTGTASTATLANTATVATNAQGLTGTPNITVGTVTGTDATFSGNLTVQGTTTTIDTAVTSVDSLQIDGSLKVGTTQDSSFPDRLVSVGSTIRTSSYIDIRSTTTGALLFADGLSGDSAYRGQVEYRHNDDSMRLWTAAGERLRIKSDGTTLLNGTALFKGGLAEKVNVKSQLTGANACAITAGNVILTTSNEPGNTYPNITGVHSLLESGQGFSVTIALKVNGSGTINGFHIDGQAQTVEWSGGSAPSAGSAGYDVFTFSAFKTGSGATDYTVFGAATNYD